MIALGWYSLPCFSAFFLLSLKKAIRIMKDIKTHLKKSRINDFKGSIYASILSFDLACTRSPHAHINTYLFHGLLRHVKRCGQGK